MRVVIFMCALMLSACAGQPATSAAPATTVVAKASQKGAASAVVDASGNINKDALVNAKKMGFTPVNKDGAVLFCRNDLKTGSRVERETVCLTAQEIDDLRQQTERQLRDFSQTPHPTPHN